MIDWSSCSAVERDPERMSYAWVFRGTRVPVLALFENLADGALLTDFVAWFPGVTAAQACTVSEHATRGAPHLSPKELVASCAFKPRREFDRG